jgi:hypothetical protein
MRIRCRPSTCLRLALRPVTVRARATDTVSPRCSPPLKVRLVGSMGLDPVLPKVRRGRVVGEVVILLTKGLSPYQIDSSGPPTFSPQGLTPTSMMPPPTHHQSFASGSMPPSASPPAFFYSSSQRYTPTAPLATAIVSNPFDEILPRTLLMTIINLYFDYINALTPCLHKPSILRDLQARREEREHPERDEWISLIMTTVALTLVQMPRAFVPLPRKEVGGLARRCYLRSREYTRQEDRRPTVNLCKL